MVEPSPPLDSAPQHRPRRVLASAGSLVLLDAYWAVLVGRVGDHEVARLGRKVVRVGAGDERVALAGAEDLLVAQERWE